MILLCILITVWTISSVSRSSSSPRFVCDPLSAVVKNTLCKRLFSVYRSTVWHSSNCTSKCRVRFKFKLLVIIELFDHLYRDQNYDSISKGRIFEFGIFDEQPLIQIATSHLLWSAMLSKNTHLGSVLAPVHTKAL